MKARQMLDVKHVVHTEVSRKTNPIGIGVDAFVDFHRTNLP